jgi:acid phosphatase family membrane protein YuiD
MNIVKELTGNYILNVGIISWFIAQLLKLIYDYVTTKEFDIGRFLGGAGGMPSSHSAVVCSVCVATYKICGPSSTEFALSAVLAMIVMYDASGVRRAAGEQAKVLNTIIEKWQEPQFMENELKELLGHTPFEVLAGALLGVLIALIY